MERRGSRELSAVAQRFTQWRKQSGGRGSRIPAELWNEAARVARVRGVYATARALRLNYEGLKTRVGAPAGQPASSTNAEAGFVELRMGPLPVAGTVIELFSPRGDQMRIHLAGASTAELVCLAQAFWGGRS